MSVPRAATPLLCALLTFAPATAQADAPALPEAGALAVAQAVRTLPCSGEAAEGFAPVEGVPPAWHLAGTLVSVRRDPSGNRFAFVLGPPQPGAVACSVRDLVPLPRRGEILECTLADGSVQGLGAHALLEGGGRRTLLFWPEDGAGGLRRPGPAEHDYQSDTGELICTPPAPIQ